MKRFCSAVCLAVFLSASGSAVFADNAAKAKSGTTSGEVLFKQHCSMCHPEGGNIINPKKSLREKSLQASNIRSAEDIVKVMRKPGPGMTKFDEKTLPDKEAKEIAEYILKAFK
jgi:cytochrome c6